ncbi:hypothetical protein [Shinella pollutisoli]|uniref:Uncharacterized protein n=1 Tax=Shinella pollutisoli TaxID=2250594 RepID=A0ABV7DA57_9HYPH|nr:hypothetical protein [Shinella pollutisoli]
MKIETRHQLNEKFNRRADGIIGMVNPWFVGSAVLMGVAALPFSLSATLFILSVPTVYQGIGLGYRVAGYMLKPTAPSAP